MVLIVFKGTKVEAEINRGVTIPKVVTTIVKTLKDNKAKYYHQDTLLM